MEATKTSLNYCIKDDPTAYDVYKRVYPNEPLELSLRGSIGALIPVCGVPFSDKSKSFCGLSINHESHEHCSTLYREDNGTIRACNRQMFFRRQNQLSLLYDYALTYREYVEYFSISFNPCRLDPTIVRQQIYDIYFFRYLQWRWHSLIHVLRCPDDFKYFKLDFDNAQLYINNFLAAELEVLSSVIKNPELDHPTFFSDKFLVENPQTLLTLNRLMKVELNAKV